LGGGPAAPSGEPRKQVMLVPHSGTYMQRLRVGKRLIFGLDRVFGQYPVEGGAVFYLVSGIVAGQETGLGANSAKIPRPDLVCGVVPTMLVKSTRL
jgi:hypothetical protein